MWEWVGRSECGEQFVGVGVTSHLSYLYLPFPPTLSPFLPSLLPSLPPSLPLPLSLSPPLPQVYTVKTGARKGSTVISCTSSEILKERSRELIATFLLSLPPHSGDPLSAPGTLYPDIQQAPKNFQLPYNGYISSGHSFFFFFL